MRSPLLFLIYVNDLPIDPVHNCRAGQFADDISVWTTQTSVRGTYVKIQKTLSDVEKCCSRWRIKLNVAKTQLMTFSNERRPITHARKYGGEQLKLFGATLKEQPTFKLLGV